MFFFFTATATTEIYTLSLHDALPISWPLPGKQAKQMRSRLSGGYVLNCEPLAQRLQDEERGGVSSEVYGDRKSTRLNSSHVEISYAVFCLKKKKTKNRRKLAQRKNKH